jgi:hypothetical protein
MRSSDLAQLQLQPLPPAVHACAQAGTAATVLAGCGAQQGMPWLRRCAGAALPAVCCAVLCCMAVGSFSMFVGRRVQSLAGASSGSLVVVVMVVMVVVMVVMVAADFLCCVPQASMWM